MKADAVSSFMNVCVFFLSQNIGLYVVICKVIKTSWATPPSIDIPRLFSSMLNSTFCKKKRKLAVYWCHVQMHNWPKRWMTPFLHSGECIVRLPFCPRVRRNRYILFILHQQPHGSRCWHSHRVICSIVMQPNKQYRDASTEHLSAYVLGTDKFRQILRSGRDSMAGVGNHLPS